MNQGTNEAMNQWIIESMNQWSKKSTNYKNVHLPTTATLSTGGLLIKGAPMTKMKKLWTKIYKHGNPKIYISEI